MKYNWVKYTEATVDQRVIKHMLQMVLETCARSLVGTAEMRRNNFNAYTMKIIKRK